MLSAIWRCFTMGYWCGTVLGIETCRVLDLKRSNNRVGKVIKPHSFKIFMWGFWKMYIPWFQIQFLSHMKKDWTSDCSRIYWNLKKVWRSIGSRTNHIIRWIGSHIEQHNIWIFLIEYIYYSTYWNTEMIKSTRFQIFSNRSKTFGTPYRSQKWSKLVFVGSKDWM